MIDRAVADGHFLLGTSFTAADIMMGYPLQMVRYFKVLDQYYPNALAYLERLKGP